MNEKNEKKLSIKYIFLAILASLGFCINNSAGVLTSEAGNMETLLFEKILGQLICGIQENSYIACLIVFLLYFAFKFVDGAIEKDYKKWGIPISVVSAVIVLLCKSYFECNSWQQVFGSQSAFGLSLLKGIGLAVMFYYSVGIIFSFRLNSNSAVARRSISIEKVIKCTILILILWIPYMVIMFPGCMNADTRDQIAQCLGNRQYCFTSRMVELVDSNVIINNNHPVFFTWLISIVLRVGKIIGSYAWAFEGYSILQCICLAGLFAYIVVYLMKKGLSHKVCRFMVLFYALNPIFPLYGMTVMKDVPFAITFALLVIYIYDFLTEPETFSGFRYFRMGLCIILFLLFRNNGIYLLGIVLPCMLIVSAVQKKKKQMLKTIFVFSIPIVVVVIGFQGILFSKLHISPGSSREILSVPIQQTARLVKYHQSSLEGEDRENICAMFDTSSLEEIGKLYVPDRADSVKIHFNSYATDDDLKNYLHTWVKYLIRYPKVYVEAYLNLNYSWFSFDSNQDNRYYNGIIDSNITVMLNDVKNYDVFIRPRKMLSQIVDLLGKLPFTAWMVEFSFYTWAFWIMFILMIKRKRVNEIIASLIIYGNYLICFVGPVAYMRYVLPMMTCFPVVLMFTFSKERDREKLATEEK